jgi:hypothetical protein
MFTISREEIIAESKEIAELDVLIDKNLTETSSLETLRRWSEWIELFAEAIENHQNRISTQSWSNLEKLAQRIIAVTCIKNHQETKKNHYKRALKHSATFILSQVESNKSKKSWELVIGKKSYQELLRESQRKINLLDNLDPKTNEEAKKQSDTLDYLENHLR